MSFSEIFKENRKSLGYTQEEIASRLMVTPQAVSKWENASAMPDIALIVPIARLFGITTDELLGNSYKSSEEICAELDEAVSINDDVKKRYEKYWEMVKAYPNSIEALSHLMTCTAEYLAKCKNELSDEEIKEIIDKAIVISGDIRRLGEEKGGNLYTYSHAYLADVYMSIENFEKAKAEIEYLPYCRYSKARMQGNLCHREKKYDEAIEYYRESISDSIFWLFWDVERLAHSLWKSTCDNSQSLEIFKLEYDLIHRLYNDNMFPIPVTQYLLTSNIQLAAKYARDGVIEKTYMHLDEIFEILCEYDKGYGNTNKTGCILYPNAMQPFNRFNKKISYKRWLNKRLQWNSFDSVRGETRFAEYLKRVEQLD